MVICIGFKKQVNLFLSTKCTNNYFCREYRKYQEADKILVYKSNNLYIIKKKSAPEN